MEAAVFHDQIVSFLEAAVVFLLVTNALSVVATTYAIQLLNGATGGRPCAWRSGSLFKASWKVRS